MDISTSSGSSSAGGNRNFWRAEASSSSGSAREVGVEEGAEDVCYLLYEETQRLLHLPPHVFELLAKHADAIIELRGRVAEAPHYKADDYDDIFLLRFLLSNGTIDKAETNLRSTFVFRHERIARSGSNPALTPLACR